MDWTNDSILIFLRLYKMHSCIWNTKHKDHRNRNRVNDAWVDIQSNMPIPCTIPQLKKKKESLMSAYRAYKTKIKNSTSVNGGAVYQPSWFAFGAMDSFLASVYLCNPSQWRNDTDENEPNTDNATDSNTPTNDPDTNPLEIEDHDPNKEKTPAIKRSHSPSEQKSQNAEPATSTPQKPKRSRYQEFYSYPNRYLYQQKEEDECDIIVKLWARKLRKLPEERRDLLIYKINTLMYKESVDHYRATASSPGIIIPSPVQIFREDDSEISDSNSCNDNRLDGSPNSNDTKEFDNTLYEGEVKPFKSIKLFKRQ